MTEFLYKNHRKEPVRVFIGSRSMPYTKVGPGMERLLSLPWAHFQLENFEHSAHFSEYTPPKRKA